MVRSLSRVVLAGASALIFVISTAPLARAQDSSVLDTIELARRYAQEQRYDVAIAMLQQAMDQMRRVQSPRVDFAPSPRGPVVRIGGDVRAPARLYHVDPAYPAVARAARVQGRVILEATINEAGEVANVVTLRSPSPLLEEAAVDAVRQWRYTPTMLNSEPVGVVMTVTVDFSLDR
jgi:TonB family protein